MKYPFFFIILCGIFISFSGFSQTPLTKWRGPEGNGVYPDKNLLTEWPSSGPEIVWTFDKIGIGHSSPSFAHDRIYINGMEDETGYVYALSKKGVMLWKAPYGPEFSSSYPGTRSSVTVAGELLYVLSGRGRLVCLRADNGKVKWSKDLFKEFDGRNLTWGITETVVVDEDVVYCTPGGQKDNVLALNRHTGELIWSSPALGEKSAYCTPLLIDHGNRKILLTMTAKHIIGLDAATGKLLWSRTQMNRYAVHANTPIYQDGAVYGFSGYGRGGLKLQLNEDGSAMTKQWFNSTMNSRTGGAVLLNGNIYGSGDTNREWQCIDWETGEQKFTSREIGNGAIIAAAGLLYCYSERGELALIKPHPDKFEVLSKTRVRLGSGQHWAHPVIHDGLLYLRHGNVLIAYDISAKAE